MAVQIKERSYFLWLFLGLITFGICSIIYIYYTMDDLNKLYARHGKGEAVSVVLVFVLMLLGFGSFVYMFLIYDKLHDHVESQGGTNNVPSGIGILLWSIFLGWTIVVPLYFGWKWQDVLNQQIRR